ncbi:MAG: hypothetical protein ACKOFO_01465, partial [Gemmatimonadota bacterium]
MTSGPSHLLSADLAECLTAFALGLQKAAAHPDGHPVLEGVAAELEARLAGIHVGRPSLTIGVAPSQLLIDGVSTDPNQPVLRELAGRLHAHALGGVMLTRGVTAAELAHLLGLLATEAGTFPVPIGLEGPELLAQWPAIRLFPVSTTVDALHRGPPAHDGEDRLTQRDVRPRAQRRLRPHRVHHEPIEQTHQKRREGFVTSPCHRLEESTQCRRRDPRHPRLEEATTRGALGG